MYLYIKIIRLNSFMKQIYFYINPLWQVYLIKITSCIFNKIYYSCCVNVDLGLSPHSGLSRMKIDLHIRKFRKFRKSDWPLPRKMRIWSRTLKSIQQRAMLNSSPAGSHIIVNVLWAQDGYFYNNDNQCKFFPLKLWFSSKTVYFL